MRSEMKLFILAVLGIFIVALGGPAESRPLHKRSYAAKIQTDAGCDFTNIGRVICGPAAAAGGTQVVATRRGVEMTVDQGTIIGARPSDCPHSYCGCGLRKYLGLSDK